MDPMIFKLQYAAYGIRMQIFFNSPHHVHFELFSRHFTHLYEKIIPYQMIIGFKKLFHLIHLLITHGMLQQIHFFTIYNFHFI